MGYLYMAETSIRSLAVGHSLLKPVVALRDGRRKKKTRETEGQWCHGQPCNFGFCVCGGARKPLPSCLAKPCPVCLPPALNVVLARALLCRCPRRPPPPSSSVDPVPNPCRLPPSTYQLLSSAILRLLHTPKSLADGSLSSKSQPTKTETVP